VQALKDASLNHEIAREFLPQKAFSRAVKTMEEERVIDALPKHTKDEVTFQFTKKFLEESSSGEEEWGPQARDEDRPQQEYRQALLPAQNT
jgi:Mn-containing catalase